MIIKNKSYKKHIHINTQVHITHKITCIEHNIKILPMTKSEMQTTKDQVDLSTDDPKSLQCAMGTFTSEVTLFSTNPLEE